ncbi:hypothetical protein L3Q82_008422 [Scortum barcoo]|uniref:Uncharacterized protein n=1 Tax=Scortum barcoo TaxID=214431 RepID=A0ACB8XCH0_9TELE|nr:hypothetical protein L3Q82_008422 [Scortum barcoo]
MAESREGLQRRLYPAAPIEQPALITSEVSRGYFSRGRGGGGGGQSGVMPVVSSQEELEKLTRRHAVKVLPQAGCSVEEVGSAVGEVVGFESVKSASRMNSAVVIFSG